MSSAGVGTRRCVCVYGVLVRVGCVLCSCSECHGPAPVVCPFCLILISSLAGFFLPQSNLTTGRVGRVLRGRCRGNTPGEVI